MIKRLGVCGMPEIVCKLGLGYLSWHCIRVWCNGLCLWVEELQGAL